MATTHTNRLQSTAITPVRQEAAAVSGGGVKPIEPADLAEVMTFAQIAVKSSTFGLKNVEEAAFRILYGRELGLSAWASIMGVQMIQGQPSLKAATAAALIRRSGVYDFAEVEATPSSCELAFFRHGKQVGSTRFTLDDAKRAGLVRDGSGWAKYPGDMCFARALMRGFRRFCSDLTLGPIYDAEELTSGFTESDVIDVELAPQVPVVEPEPVVETKPAKAARKPAKVEPMAEVKPPANDALFDEVEQAQAETTADKTRKLDEWADRVAKRFDEKGQASFASAGTVVEEMYRRFLDLGFVVPGATTYRARTGAIAAIDAPWAEILDNLKGFAAELAAELDAPPAEDTREPGAEG